MGGGGADFCFFHPFAFYGVLYYIIGASVLHRFHLLEAWLRAFGTKRRDDQVIVSHGRQAN